MDSIKALVLPLDQGHQDDLSPLALLYLPHKGVQLYVEHLKSEEKSNSGRNFIRFIYLAGIILSIIATLYILDKYAKR